MKRKVVKLGPTTLVVSIPSKWSKQNNIAAGHEIELTETEDGLLLHSGKKEKQIRQITVNVTEKNMHNLYHILTHVYRRGFDKVKINGDNISHQVKKITEEVLLGFELTERAKDYCVIENIAEPSDEKFETMLRRVFLVIKETHDKVAESFKENNFKGQEIEDLKKQNDKFVFFCRRILFANASQESILKWSLLTELTQSQHAYYYLYKHVEKHGFVKDRNILEIMDGLKEYFHMFYESYYRKDAELVHRLHMLKDKYQFGRCLELIEGKKNAVIYSHIREIFRLIQIGTSPLLSLFEEY
ncbi:MAG: hypothetical protein V1740_04830 [Candidatus Woesearchaeota archaeon]